MTAATRTRRPARAAVLLLALTLLGGALGAACGGSDDADAGDDSPDATTPGNDEAGTGDEAGSEGRADVDVAAVATDAAARVEAAADICAALAVYQEAGTVAGEPTTPEDVRAVVSFLTTFMRKAADSDGNAERAGQVLAGADRLEVIAAEADYDPSELDISGEGPDDEVLQTGIAGLSKYLAEVFPTCAPAESTTTVAP